MDIKKNTILSLIHKRFGNYKISGDEIIVKCPFCVLRGQKINTSYKLYINIKKHLYNCFRCEARGKLVNLFPQLAAIEIKAEDILKDTETKLEQLPQNMQYLENLKYPWNDLVYEFLHDKKFLPATINSKVFFVEDYKKNNMSFGPRLVFPIYQFGTYRGFQARTIYKSTDPKYVGASFMDRRSILYNYDIAFSQSKELIITEGFFDCLRVGDCAIATLGKSVTEMQIRLIKLGDFKRVVVFLDQDAEYEATQVAEKLCMYFPTYIAYPNKKDPGEMNKEEIDNILNFLQERTYYGSRCNY